MCRLFGFKSVIQSQVHQSLTHAENALSVQSSKHPDGWGLVYYLGKSPHLIRSEKSALSDSLFKKISGVVSSQTVLAHIRKATAGEVNILNTHPFQFGRWVFAHNGNIKNFDQHRPKIESKISPRLKRFILGKTDSELLFYFFLTNLEIYIDLYEGECSVETLHKSLKESLIEIESMIGPCHQDNDGSNTETYLTFIMTNGEAMMAHHGGKNLYYSTYKDRCSERDSCSYFSPECEKPTQTGKINHLIFSSEPLSGENIWIAMNPGQMIGIDKEMKIQIY